MNVLQEIIDFLLSKYQPVAIILHGSRAVAKSRPHSDWDFYLLYDHKPPRSMGREIVASQEVEWRACQVPMTDEQLLDVFNTTLQFGKVVWERDSFGTRLVEHAMRVYSRGFPTATIDSKLLLDQLHAMEDSHDTPYIFLHYQFEFFRRALSWWYNLRGKYCEPYYLAFPKIQEADPEYHALLMVVCGDDSIAMKVAAGKQLFIRLFPEQGGGMTSAIVPDPERQIIQRLRDQHNPLAIVLHGSRAVHKGRPRSSWDVFLLFNEAPDQTSRREEIAGANVQWSARSSEVPDEQLIAAFGVKLQLARVLWEEDSAGTNLLQQAARVYVKGLPLSELRLPLRKLYLTHKLLGMEDDREAPYMFLKHQHIFFTRAVDWWFAVRSEYGKPFYLAIPHIQAADPEYYGLLMTMCGDGSKAGKIEAGYQLLARLFAER